jgi:hypothetical protein
MVFTKTFSDNSRAFFMRLIVAEMQFVHRVHNPSLNRLKPVADIRQSASGDDRHRVGKIRLLHFLFEVPGYNFSFVGLFLHFSALGCQLSAVSCWKLTPDD